MKAEEGIIARKIESFREAPEPFASALEDEIYSAFARGWVLYTPAIPAGEEMTPPTVLAISDNGWMLASKNEDDSVSVEQCKFADTLFLELTSLVLWGQLKIDFASVGTSYSAAARFNTVDEAFYREAVDLLLQGIDRTPGTGTGKDQDPASVLKDWPLKFRNEVLSYLPKGQRLLAAEHWPALMGGFGRELAPAAALLVTERELVLIADEKAPDWYRGEWAKYGGIITYFPLVRLADFHVSHQERFSVLALQAHTRHGAEKLEIFFPSNYEQRVSKAMERARTARAIEAVAG